MFFAYLTLFTALVLATVAGVFSVTGMMALFAGIPMAGLAVGIAVELGKLMSVSWLYRHWRDGVWFRHLMALAAIVSMLVTSIGVYGYLSKAHYEQGKDITNNSAKIQTIDEKIDRLEKTVERRKEVIKNGEKSLKQLDDQIQTIIEHGNISGKQNGSRAVLREQKPDRDKIEVDIKKAEAEIDSLQEKISSYNDEKLGLGNEVRKFEVEVGPIKSVASLLFDDPEKNMDRAIRFVIIMIMFSLDPMAIMLLMGFNHIVIKRNGFTAPPTGNKKEDPKQSKKFLIEEAKSMVPFLKNKFENIKQTLNDTLSKTKATRSADVQVKNVGTNNTDSNLVQNKEPQITTDDIKPHDAPTKRLDVVDGKKVFVQPSEEEKHKRMIEVKSKINSTPKEGLINNINKRPT